MTERDRELFIKALEELRLARDRELGYIKFFKAMQADTEPNVVALNDVIIEIDEYLDADTHGEKPKEADEFKAHKNQVEYEMLHKAEIE